MARGVPPASSSESQAQSVSDLTRRIKEVLEGSVTPGWVRGEITNFRPYASGHLYFTLKDATAQISAVIFKGDAARLRVALRDGLQVLVSGSLSVYEARGQYQLVVRTVVEDGVGRLQREFEALKQRLAAEGLFAPERKVPLPGMPSVVGFITSPTGAAVQDFLRILTRRGWRGRVVVLPSKVQGEGAAAEMAAMLAEAEALNLFDLLVIGRGGGSIEDLWAFNEEVLVRAVSNCRIPIISAVGHEIDFTLCDFAADLRAETPSAAAELISSRFVEALSRCERAARARMRLLDTEVAGHRRRLDHAASRLKLLSPSAQVEQGYLRLDDLQNRLAAALGRCAALKRSELQRLSLVLGHRSPQRRIEQDSHRLLALWKRLQAASPASVLNRGFAIVRDADGHPIQRARQLDPGLEVTASFADGSAALTVRTRKLDTEAQL